MSEFKGTPGPWHQNKWGAIVDSNGNSVSFRGVCILCSGDSKDIAEAEANTTLGTAAPELLEALSELLEYGLRMSGRHEAPAFQKARDAIAKATGD